MLATLVIGLREGVEASLIVGIIAAFLNRSGRRDALRWVWLGVVLAIAICLAGGVTLRILEQKLPGRQQEGFEAIVGLFAVGVVSYMIVWMRSNARSMRSSLEHDVTAALTEGSVLALVGMSFFAVMREGFETAVFQLAIFQNSNTSATAGMAGALIGLVIAAIIGYGIYRGGVRLNMAKYFKITGAVLVLVAAGLIASSLHAAHNAGWLNVLQAPAINLTGIIRPGSVVAALVTGMLGIRPVPTIAETIGWLVYLIPVGLFVLWPQRGGRPASSRTRQQQAPNAVPS